MTIQQFPSLQTYAIESAAQGSPERVFSNQEQTEAVARLFQTGDLGQDESITFEELFIRIITSEVPPSEEMLRILVRHPEINFQYGILEALGFGYVRLAKELMLDPRFSQTSLEDLDDMFALAVNNNHPELLQPIFDHKLFSWIRPQHFRALLSRASSNGYADVVRALKTTEHFKKLKRKEISQFFQVAAQNNHGEVVRAFLGGRRDLVPSDEVCSAVLEDAVQNGRRQVAWAIARWFIQEECEFIAFLAGSVVLITALAAALFPLFDQIRDLGLDQ